MKACLRFAFVATVGGFLLSLFPITQTDAGTTWRNIKKPSGSGAKGYVPPASTTPRKPKNK